MDFPIKKHAVLVGINKYYHDLRSLIFCDQDAKELKFILLDPERGDFDREELKLFIDENPVEQLPTRNNVMKALLEMANKAGENDVILFYFSGHGMEEDGITYLLPADSSIGLLKESGISLDWVLETFKKSRARVKIMILDACRESVEDTARAVCPPMSKGFSEAIDRMVEKGWGVFSSCSPGELSYEDPDLKHGVFSYYLLEGLRQAADFDQDGKVTLSEINKYVTPQVKESVKNKKDRSQTPNLKCDLRCHDITIVNTPTREVKIEQTELGKHITLPLEQLGWYRDKKSEPSRNPSSDDAEIHLIPFRSAYDFLHDRNNKFHLRFFLPKKRIMETSKPDHLFIMFPGLGESLTDLYDEIALDLAERGHASVFLPLPNHFCRHVEFETKPNDLFYPKDIDTAILISQRILQDVIHRPTNVIQGLKQVIQDTENLIANLPLFLGKFISHNPKISLFGHSLGGFVVLALLLKHGETVFESAYLLESGSNLDDVDASYVFQRLRGSPRVLWNNILTQYKKNIMPKKEDADKYFAPSEPDVIKSWNEFVDDVIADPTAINKEKYGPQLFVRGEDVADTIWKSVVGSLFSGLREASYLTADEKRILERILLGNDKFLYRKDLARFCERLFIVLGGVDEVFRARSVMSFAPEETGLAIIQIPEMGHWIKHRYKGKWGLWKKFVLEAMMCFEEHRPKSQKPS